MNRPRSGRLTQLKSEHLALLGVVFLLVAVLVVNLVPEANQYELSLYDALPIYFWLLVAGAMVIGAVLVLRASQRPRDGSWKFGVSLILLGDALLLLLPYMRGYQFWGRGDTLSHIGFVRDILASGDLAGNIYPAAHLLVIALQSATGVELSITTLLVPLGLSVVYLGGMYYLVTTLFEDRTRRLYGLAFGLVLVLGPSHLMLRPFDQSLALLPLVLFLFVKEQRYPSRATRTAFVVALGAFLFYHPLTALFAIVVFVLYLLSRRALWVDQRFVSPTNFVSLSLAVFLIWYTNFAGIILRFDRIYGTLAGEAGGNTPLARYTETLDQASPAFVDVVRVATFKYGLEGVLFGIGFALFGLTVLYLFNRKYPFNTQETMLLWATMLFSLGGLTFLVLDLIVPPERPFQIAKLGAVVLAGQLFYLLRTSVDWDGLDSRALTGFKTLTVITLVLLVTLSMFSVYNSPLESESNEQVTEMELEGTEWLTTHPGAADSFVEFDMVYQRFYHAHNGVGPHAFQGGAGTRDPPVHFNYTTYDTLGESYEDDQYMIITRKGRIVYPQSFAGYEEFWRYTPSDFERLEHDTTVGRIYDNGDVELYLVDGVRN